jgi:hypothetical protein
MRWLGCALLGLVAVSLGCNGDLGIQKMTPNRPPETSLSGGPRDSTAATPYHVPLFWSGSDPDGTIDHYDFILVDHPASRSSIEGEDSLTTVVITVPGVDDPRWQGTTSTDSLFVTLADTLRRDPQPGPGENEDMIRNTYFERWHTFFVRAVDNDGMPDATPDYRTFNATNLAPTVHMMEPIRAGDVFSAPSTVVFNWDGADDTGTGDLLEPVAARWVIIPSRIDWLGNYLSFPDSLYHLPKHGAHQYAWSAFSRWDASDGSGRRAVVRGLDEQTSLNPDFGYYIFAVQAMDEAGAVTPVFDWTTSRKNNVSLVKVSGRVGPILTIEDRFLGRFTFAEGSRPVRFDIGSGQPLSLCWNADASRYGGSIVGYRYGWDILNPEDDAEWSSWNTSTTCAPTRTFNAGIHRFFLQVLDIAGTVLQATIEFHIHSITRTRDVLLVDDTIPLARDSDQEADEDQMWLDSFDALAQARGIDFNSGRDVFDTAANALGPPPIRMLFEYKAVVWSVRASTAGSALAALARFVDPYDPENINSVRSYNYLLAYLRNGGKLWISGFRPANELWPIEREAGHETDAINIMEWDPHDRHPRADSVGALSLLYEMGIEMWDCGSGTGCFRSGRDHYCRTVERSVPQGFAEPEYATTTTLRHAHGVRIPTADVDAAPAGGRTYVTTNNEGHQHLVQLTYADFLELQRGNAVLKETSEDGPPQTELHHHTVEIFDRFGLWGAPALAFGSGWDQGGPGSGHDNVEIYNMPGQMSQETPPLLGKPGVIDLYRYRSAKTLSSTLFFPNTADQQPVFMLAKHRATDRLHSRAFMGFESELLTPEAQQRLLDFIVWRHFRVDLDDF